MGKSELPSLVSMYETPGITWSQPYSRTSLEMIGKVRGVLLGGGGKFSE